MASDYRRMAELVEQHGDMPLGAAGASMVALAERLNITTIMALDKKHFNVVLPRRSPT